MNSNNIAQQITSEISEKLGHKNLPKEAQESFRENMEAEVLRRIGLIIMQHLDEKGMEAYEKLIEENPAPSAADMQSFLESYLPDYQEKIKTGIEDFIKEIVNYLKEDNK